MVVGPIIGVLAWIALAVRAMVGGRIRATVMIPVVVVVRTALMIAIPIPALIGCWWALGITVVAIALVPVAVTITVMIAVAITITSRIIIWIDGNKVGSNPVPKITDIAGIIRIDRIARSIESYFAMGHSFRAIDRELETAIERQLRADYLLRIRGTLHQIFAAVDIALGNEVTDDILTALAQLFAGQLMGFVEQGEQGR